MDEYRILDRDPATPFMKVSAILRGKTDKKGRQTIYIRTNIGEKRLYKATRIKLEPAQFSNGKVIGHSKAKLYNDIIREAIHDAEAVEIKQAKHFPDADYRTYLEKCLDQWKNAKDIETNKQIRRYNEQFLEQVGEIKLGKVTVEMLNRHKAYLEQLYGGSNTVWKALTRMRTIYTVAAKQEKIIKDDPFDVFIIPPYKQTKRNYLTQEEVDRMEAYTFSKNCPPILKPYAVWFLIGCYTGLRFSDMAQFEKKQHIKGGRLILHTMKTDEVVSIPFVSKLQALFEAVDYKWIGRSNQKFNGNLKYLMAACEIEATLTAHVSRHTFAVRCASASIPIEVTAKLLAQTDTKSTAVYYKITDRKIDDEFNKLF